MKKQVPYALHMSETHDQNQRPSSRVLNTRPCPTCDAMMKFTGLPDVSGPVYFRIYKCANCGYIRQDVEAEDPQGWG